MKCTAVHILKTLKIHKEEEIVKRAEEANKHVVEMNTSSEFLNYCCEI
jgi:hypothetical protein